ncbi:MAG: CotH kinase family protein [Myxococcota bacterium]
MLLPLLLACVSSVTVGDDRDPPRRPGGDDTAVDPSGDTADPTDTADTDTGVEVIPTDTSADTAAALDAEAAVFHLDSVHTVDITLLADGRARLDADPYTYVPADVTIDGVVFPNVGVRIKGRLGSYRALTGKSALKVDLLEFDGTEKLYGLEKFNLNNMVQDCAKVKELAAYAIHRATGTPAPRVAYAEVTVDGAPFGLYSLVEDYDDAFLQANFPDPTGNLYDGDYHLWPDGSYTLVDFTAAGETYFTLDEGADVALADIHAVTTAFTGGGLGAVGAIVDLRQHAAFLAATAWTGHYDSYSYYANNYRVYFDPGRGGRAVFLPWDPDWAFYAPTAVNTPYGAISAACLADTACRAEVVAHLDTLSATVPGGGIEAEVRAAMALIRPALDRDPRLEDDRRNVRACQDDLLGWFARRGGELDAAGL